MSAETLISKLKWLNGSVKLVTKLVFAY